MSPRQFAAIWIEQCHAAERIMRDHGVRVAFDYVVAEKLVNYAIAARTLPDFARELPAFISRLRSLFDNLDIGKQMARVEDEVRTKIARVVPQATDEVDIDDLERALVRIRVLREIRDLLTADRLGTS